MDEIIAFPLPVDPAAAPWLAPVFGLMALTAFTVVVWQAVRYLRDSDHEGEPRFGDEPDAPPRDDRVE
jgi:hypothetical protein